MTFPNSCDYWSLNLYFFFTTANFVLFWSTTNYGCLFIWAQSNGFPFRSKIGSPSFVGLKLGDWETEFPNILLGEGVHKLSDLLKPNREWARDSQAPILTLAPPFHSVDFYRSLCELIHFSGFVLCSCCVRSGHLSLGENHSFLEMSEWRLWNMSIFWLLWSRVSRTSHLINCNDFVKFIQWKFIKS